MWKKILLSLVFVIAILSGLYSYRNHFYQQPETVQEPTAAPSQPSFEDKDFAYNVQNLPEKCQLNSAMGCAVEFAVKCTLNPNYTGCRQSKLPKFIFMDDETLQRPTEMTFKINKIKPIAPDLIEIYTQSTCNGNWFGLCQGRIIYVLVPEASGWRVKDIYAIEK